MIEYLPDFYRVIQVLNYTIAATYIAHKYKLKIHDQVLLMAASIIFLPGWGIDITMWPIIIFITIRNLIKTN